MVYWSVGDIIQPYFSLSGYPPPTIQGYQWLSNDNILVGYTGNTYQIGTADIGNIISVNITAINFYGSTVSNISIGDAVTGSTTDFAPFFTGTPNASAVGQTTYTQVFIDDIGSTGNPAPIVSYRWSQSGSIINGAVNQSYTPTVTGPLLGNITLSNYVGSTGATIDFGTVIESGNFAPTFTGTPQGSTLTPHVGERLEFLNYGSTGVPEPVTSFQWYDDDVVISGATGYAYVVGATGELADAKKTIIVTVANLGDGNRFYFDGVENPANYPLSRGIEYIFDQSDSSNAGHPLVLKNGEVNYAWTTDTNPGGGSSNGIGVRTLIVPANAPASLTYVCGVHGSGMGNSIAVTDVINSTIAGHIEGVVTTTNELGSVGETVDFGIIGAELVAPSFTGTPSASVVGQTAGFAVSIQNVGATGYPPPSTTYYWTQNGSIINGAGGQSYTPSSTGPLFGNVTITNGSGSTGATVDFGSIIASPGSFWEPFSVAQSEISSLSENQSIDFGVRKFAASDSDHQAGGIDLTARSVGISGGRFSMAKTTSWVDVGDGVYAADHDFSDYESLMFYLMDQNATTKPLLAVTPSPPSEMDPYRFCYNGNWFTVNKTNSNINNGIVHTVAGDNAYNETILGWTITDATLKSQVNDILAGVTVGVTAGPWTLIHSSSNTVSAARIESWDNASGGLTLAGLGGGGTTNYLTYLDFAICGIPGQTLNSGEYTWDLTNGVTAARALYKPANGDASDARIPVSDYCFKLGGGAGVGVTLENVTMEGQAFRGSAAGVIRDNGAYGSAVVSNCSITDGSRFARINYTPITFDKCVMRRCSGRGAAVCDGSTFTNNIVDHIESFSGILIQTATPTSTLRHSHIENNVLSLEASTHGQGLSLYKDSWRNATIGHNIFYNCQRAHSFQPYDAAGIGVTLAYDYTFENNLVVVDKVLDIQGFESGQKSISFNGTEDTGLSGSDGAQTVTIRNNTVVMTDQVPSYFVTANRKQLTSIDIRKIQHSTVVVENNIASTINAPAIDDGVNAGHTHANNLQYVYDNTGSISVTDKLVHTNRDDYLESGTFQGKTVAGGASDGGVLGVRWSTIPTSTQIQQIVSTDDVNWASTYPALSLPAGASYSRAYEDTQVWGLTGGGTGDLGPWQPANASWGSDAGHSVYAYGAVGAAGVTGWKPGRNAAYCSPDYSGDNIMWMWDFYGLTLERDNFVNGMSGDYFRLQVTVIKGGSGDNSAGGYYAGNTGQVYNYYWDPNTLSTYTTDAMRWTIGDLGTGSDEWPTSGITGHMWGDNPLYTQTFQSTPFSADGTVSLTYSLPHIGYPEP